MCTHFTFCCVSEADKVDISAATDFVVPFSELLLAMEVGEESLSFFGFDFLAAAPQGEQLHLRMLSSSA